jgi:hypothetical protein
VRLIKWWNNQHEGLKQSSYFCELITAASLEKRDVADNWPETLLHVFSFLQNHQFLTPIAFHDYYEPNAIALPDDCGVGCSESYQQYYTPLE